MITDLTGLLRVAAGWLEVQTQIIALPSPYGDLSGLVMIKRKTAGRVRLR